MTLISVFVTSPDTHSERRIDSDFTVQQLKDKLTPITGISPHYQVLKLYRSTESPASEAPLASLDDASRSLASYGIEEWNCIKVENIDPNFRPGEFTDESNLERFELSNAEYEARQGRFTLGPWSERYTVLSHLKANKLGRFADVPASLTHPPPPPLSAPSSIAPGARCEVIHGDDGLGKRGTVRFVGEAKIGRGGVWVGVELDEPMGKGEGEVEGIRYFSCSPRHAVFVRPEKVKVGDYPEEDLMADDDEDEI